LALLQLEDVVSGYGAVEILHGISLQVDEGEIVSLIGPNGAGKSTILRTISALLPCRRGKKFFQGRDITKVPAHEVTKLGLVQVPEGKQIFGPMTVYQNLLLGCYSKYGHLGQAGRERMLEFVFGIFPVLAERKEQHAGTLSGGEQQMLAIARALMAEPKLLLMDEPSLGLGPIVVEEIFKVLQELQKEGLTILLAEQNAMAALGLASRSYLVEEGNIVLHGESKDLTNNEKVKQVYLGGIRLE
jgi:branched-chain amino acid transport system ATP-binding protein